MKQFLSILLPLAITAAPSPERTHRLHERQLFSLGSIIGATGPAIDAVILKKLTPEIDAAATREMKMWGPFKLKASNDTHGAIGLSGGIKLDPNSDLLNGNIAPPCTDCTVLSAVANLAYKDGRQADVGSGVYTHHIIMMQNGRSQLMNPVVPDCKGASKGFLGGLGGSGGSSFLSSFGNLGASMGGAKSGKASGHEHMKRQDWLQKLIPKVAVFVGGGGSVGSGSVFAVKDSKVKSGAYVGPSDTFLFSSEVVNYDKFEKDIYLTLDFEWVPNKTEKLLNVGMGSVGLNCTTFTFQPPTDKPVTFTGTNWTVIDDGYFVNFTPHLHDGALNVKVYLNEQEICESKALYGAADGSTTIGEKKWQTITGYTPCAYMKPFKKGDKIRITSDYDLTKHILRPDSHDSKMSAEGMAMATFIWAKAV